MGVFLNSRPVKVLLCLMTLFTFCPTATCAWALVEPMEEPAVEVRDGTDPSGAGAGIDQPSASGHVPRLLTEDEMGDIKGGEEDAASALAAADTLRQERKLIEAALAYLAVIDAYPQSAEARQAEAALRDMFQTEEPTEEQLDEGQSRMPSLASLSSPESKIRVGQFLLIRGQRAREADNTEAANTYFGLAKDAAWQVMQDHPDSPVQAHMVRTYLDAAEGQGFDEAQGAAAVLEQVINQHEPCMLRTFARFELSRFLLDRLKAPGESYLQLVDMLGELKHGFIDQALADPTVSDRTKGRIEYALGDACWRVGRRDEALARYERVLDLYPDTGELVEQAGFAAAFARSRLSGDDPMVGIREFEKFIERHPNSRYASGALLQVGRIYAQQGDYSAAANVYRQVMQDYPDSGAAKVAESELGYLIRNLMDSVEVAAVSEEQEAMLAQLCGPTALQKLLAMRGVDSTVDELAKLAGTDDTGTTMLGLVNAAKAKGLELAGVQSSDLKRLPAPFIAYVNGNHFVLVTEVNGDSLVVTDSGRPETTVSLREFESAWDGKALVSADAKEVATLLEVATLKGAKGGCPEDNTDECINNFDPCPDDDPCCELAGNGGAGNSGGKGRRGGPGKALSRAAGSPTSLLNPSQKALAGFSAPGVNPTINTFQSALGLNETDISIGTRGPMGVSFKRNYANNWGFNRGYYTDTSKPWKCNIGHSWTHNMNMHIRTSNTTQGSPPHPVLMIVYNVRGNALYYDYVGDFGSYNIYQMTTSHRTTRDSGTHLWRDTSTSKITMGVPTGLQYGFSAPTTDSYKYARLEWIKDASGNQIGLEYNGSVASGRLTKITTPSGDDRYLQVTYSGNLITKVELKDTGGTIDEVQYAYTGSELVTVTDKNSNTVQYWYGEDDTVENSRYISKIRNKDGEDATLVWTYDEIDAPGQPYNGWPQAFTIEVTQPDGSKTKFDRSTNCVKNTVTNWDGETQVGKIVYHALPANGYGVQYIDLYTGPSTYKRWSYSYADNRDLITAWRPGGGAYLSYSYTSKGRISTEKFGYENTATLHYASSTALYPTKRTGPDGLDTYYYYDSSNRITQVKYPWSGTNGVRYTYDSYGQIISKTDGLDHVWTYAYDARGNMTSMKNPLNKETKTEYDDLGNVTKVTDPRNKSTYYYYAGGGCACGGGALLTKVKDALNNETEYAYDKNGNMTKVTDALDRATDYFYDKMNRLTKIESLSGSGNTMTYAYNKAGDMTRLTDFEGTDKYYYHDYMGRLTKVEDDGNNSVVQYTYDMVGNVSTVKDGNNNVTDLDYNTSRRLVKVTDDEGNIVHYIYDGAGRLTKKSAGLFGTVDPREYFFCTSTGLMTKVKYTSGGTSDDAKLYYDVAGRMTKMTSFGSDSLVIQYAFDAANRLTKLTDMDDSHLDYTYDDAGNVITMNDYHSNVVTYTYTDTNRVSTITSPGSKTWDFRYNALGQLTQRYEPMHAMWNYYAYDGRNRLTSLAQYEIFAEKDKFTYELDDMGNVTKVTDVDGAYWKYEYDVRYQLTQARPWTSGDDFYVTYQYTYDGAGNMVTKREIFVGAGTATYTYEYNTANELTKRSAPGDTMFTYDDWGRMISKYTTSPSQSATYAYRYGDKLKSVTTDFTGEANVEYYYTAPDGKRRGRESDGTRTNYNWDAGWNVINEEDNCGNLTMTYVHDPGKVIGTILADVPGDDPSEDDYRYYFQDNIGSTRRVRNQDKTSYALYEYKPYGEVYAHSGSDVKYRFTGKEWDDDAELYYFPYRYYAPSIARWTTRDPLGMVDGPNLYAYALNNPIKHSDRLGLEINPWTTGTLAGGGLSGPVNEPCCPEGTESMPNWRAMGYNNWGECFDRCFNNLSPSAPVTTIGVTSGAAGVAVAEIAVETPTTIGGIAVTGLAGAIAASLIAIYYQQVAVYCWHDCSKSVCAEKPGAAYQQWI